MKGHTVRAADLFCGAGGTSTGLRLACEALDRRLDLLAVNHWQVAIATHQANHPGTKHLCADLDSIDPRKAVAGGRLDLLIASPECTFHSNARGGRPINDQARASAWLIPRWCEALHVENVLIENVPEFRHWGPLDARGRPLKRRRGETFQAFINAVRSLGYTVDWRVLNAADYGDPTSRSRLFIIAHRGRKPVIWPEPTHTRDEKPTLFGRKPRWRTAREVIDWSLPAESIFSRKRPLRPKTLARIEEGLRRHCGLPFVLSQQSGGAPRSVNQPLPTIATSGAIGLVNPYLVVLRNNQFARSLDDPLPTLTTSGANVALCQPFLIKYNSTGGSISVNRTIDTITTKDRYGLVLPDLDAMLDIRFRMLQPHELARAMSFPDGYQFSGNRAERVRQIGNAVPVGIARALCLSVLSEK